MPTEAPETVTLRNAIDLAHRPNLGEDTETTHFEAGTEFTLLDRFAHFSLCRSPAGHLYNIKNTDLT